MVISFLLLLLPVAAASGWFVARQSQAQQTPKEDHSFVQGYLVGLNYLLNEQPDKAVDTFIKMLEVDSETVETHLALGALFRRRGEVDRAIRIHQNLIARPQLPKQLRSQALLALAQDYLKSGMLDRAERLFIEINDLEGEYQITALSYLLDIYQQQKRWDAAIGIANKLLAKGKPMQKHIAHYYCELAMQAYSYDNRSKIMDLLQQALSNDSHCARANLLLGSFELEQENYDNALNCYQQIKFQDADFIGEALAPISFCFDKLERQEHYPQYLQTCLNEIPGTPVILAYTNYLCREQGLNAAIEFLAHQLHLHPSIRGLQRLVELYLEDTTQKARADLVSLQETMSKFIKHNPAYRCIHCGFTSKMLHWLCPGCKEWGAVKPA